MRDERLYCIYNYYFKMATNLSEDIIDQFHLNLIFSNYNIQGGS